MKNIFLVFFAVLLIASASCKKSNFLDSKALDVLTKEITFADSANTMDFLANLYVDLDYNFPLSNNNADMSKMCDEGEGKFPALGNYDKVITTGSFASNFYGQMETRWSLFYKNIHNANIYLAEVDNSPLSAALKKRTKAEARFMRVLNYVFLTVHFGGVPLVGDKAYSTEDATDLPRGTYEECVNYMVSELDAIANELPVSYIGLNYGRITKGACLALKSRILLFAASPLYNGGSTATNPELIAATAYPTYDATRWEKARLAAKAVMDLSLYSLNTDNTTRPGNGFYKVFITRVNNEFILFSGLSNGKQIEGILNPQSRGGNFFYTPTQELVDMFPMRNGLPITDPASGYNEAANPYLNRDPRLDYTVIYNGSLYFLNSTKTLQPVNTYVGAPTDGIVAVSSNTSTQTGYFVRKMCDEFAAVTGGNNVDRALPVIRYAEILLNYAEAANEVGGSANMTEALNALKLLRIRAGITANTNGQYGLPANPTQAQLRDLIRNERAIELAFEQHRFWDLRRWKLGEPLLDGKFMHGMRITRIGTTGANYTYARVNVRTRYFKEIYYYFPIPKVEVVLNPAVLQNPGY